MTSRPILLKVAWVVLAATALLGCSGVRGQPSGTPATTVELAAKDLAYDKSELRIPADEPFAIAFENHDAVPHNVSIRGGSTPVTTEFITGPAGRTYVFAALPAGRYTFVCDLHPAMQGVLEMTSEVSRR
jgi:plastocyanin